MRSSNPYILAFIVVLGCWSIAAQVTIPTPAVRESRTKETEADKARRLRREAEIRNVVLSTSSLPIEIAADILFNVLEKKLVTDATATRSILEDIFRRAAEGREPVRKAFRQGDVDTRAGYSGHAFGQRLDRLSLQLRAVRSMLRLDKLRARAMFRDIPDIKLPPLSCEDDLDYDIGEFYQVLGELIDQTFDAEARQRLEHIHFAESYIDAISSPSQVRPVIDLLNSVRTTPQEYDLLLDSLVLSLRKLTTDPRSFAFSIVHSRVTSEVKYSLLKKVAEKGLLPDEFLRSYRYYMVKQLSAAQCADTLMTGTKEKPNSNIEFANSLFKVPIDESEIKPEKVEPGAKRFRYWQTPKAAKLLSTIRELRFGKGENALSLEERSKQEWQEVLSGFLEQMNSWKPQDENTEFDYLHQRSVLYYGLFDLVPPGPLLGTVLRDYALFLRDSRMQKDDSANWLHYVKLAMARSKKLNGKEYDEFVSIFAGAGNLAFQLYLDVERLSKFAEKA